MTLTNPYVDAPAVPADPSGRYPSVVRPAAPGEAAPPSRRRLDAGMVATLALAPLALPLAPFLYAGYVGSTLAHHRRAARAAPDAGWIAEHGRRKRREQQQLHTQLQQLAARGSAALAARVTQAAEALALLFSGDVAGALAAAEQAAAARGGAHRPAAVRLPPPPPLGPATSVGAVAAADFVSGKRSVDVARRPSVIGGDAVAEMWGRVAAAAAAGDDGGAGGGDDDSSSVGSGNGGDVGGAGGGEAGGSGANSGDGVGGSSTGSGAAGGDARLAAGRALASRRSMPEASLRAAAAPPPPLAPLAGRGSLLPPTVSARPSQRAWAGGGGALAAAGSLGRRDSGLQALLLAPAAPPHLGWQPSLPTVTAGVPQRLGLAHHQSLIDAAAVNRARLAGPTGLAQQQLNQQQQQQQQQHRPRVVAVPPIVRMDSTPSPFAAVQCPSMKRLSDSGATDGTDDGGDDERGCADSGMANGHAPAAAAAPAAAVAATPGAGAGAAKAAADGPADGAAAPPATTADGDAAGAGADAAQLLCALNSVTDAQRRALLAGRAPPPASSDGVLAGGFAQQQAWAARQLRRLPWWHVDADVGVVRSHAALINRDGLFAGTARLDVLDFVSDHFVA